MADELMEELQGRTPLETACTPAMDYLAKNGRCGTLQTVPAGHYPGSEAAILSILGYKPADLPKGRGPLEAAGMDLHLTNRQHAMRYILHDTSLSIKSIAERSTEYAFYPISPKTGLCISQIDIQAPAIEGMEFWSDDVPKKYASFVDMHKKDNSSVTRAVVIGAVPLLKGIAKETGCAWLSPAGATGDCSTDYVSIGTAAVEAIKTFDYVIVHIEACDFASHRKDYLSKIKAIENIDSHIVSPMVNYLSKEPFAIAVMPDHPCLCSTGKHTSGHVPVLLYHPGIEKDCTERYSEKEAAGGILKDISEIYG